MPESSAVYALWCGECEEGHEPDAEEPAGAPLLPPWGPFGLALATRDVQSFLEGTLDEFIHWARGDVQLWLEAALRTHPTDGAKILELACRHCPGAADYPMVHYALGHWYADQGMADASAASYARARECAPDFCFPNRLEELDILQRAVELDEADWKARYYLGNLLAGLGRKDEATAAWRAAESIEDGFAVLQRNLGLGCANWEKDLAGGAKHYARAIELNPNDYRYYMDLARIYDRDPEKSKQEQLELLLSAPPPIQDKWQIAAMIAELLQGLGRYDEALAILSAHQFFPWEGATHMRTVYANCLVAKGQRAADAGDHDTALASYEAAMEYPRNLGVGKLHYSQDAKVFWLAAKEAEVLGLADKCELYLSTAAEEPHRGPCEADVYKLLSLRTLGKDAEASELEATTRQWAEELSGKPGHEEHGKRMLKLMGAE